MERLAARVALDHVARFYRGAVFQAWLQVLWDTGYAHGEGLTGLMARPGDTAETAAQHREAATIMLSSAARLGWVRPSARPEPTPAQMLFPEGELSTALTHSYEPGYAREATNFLRTGRIDMDWKD
jgi:hypothetical protein